MKEKIEETLKRFADDTSAASSPNTSKAEGGQRRPEPTLGDPDCPHCHGLGYVRREHPVGHPDFGKLEICTCRQPELRARVRDRLYQLSDLAELAEMTFDSFVPQGHVGISERARASLEQAFNHAQLFADNPKGWLLLEGGYGCGKTHLAAAIANHAVEAGRPALFLTVPDLLDALRHAFSGPAGAFEERFDRIRRAPLLLLDDFGTQNATDWAREKLFQILNYRYIDRMPTVITTNLTLEGLEGRIRSRLSDPELVTRVRILAPDYRRPKDEASQSELSSLSLHRDQTFGTFSMREQEPVSGESRKGLQQAFDAARRYAEDPQGWLILTGPYGSGKTHLAAAIANYRSSQGFPSMFVVVPDLLDHLRATFSPKSETSYDRRFDEIRTAPLLVLDDLGTQAATPWVREKLYQLFNHRYNAGLPTVITTVDPIEKADERIRSRILDSRLCTIYAITMPGYYARQS
jgi:DNA replication protein DnaC